MFSRESFQTWSIILRRLETGDIRLQFLDKSEWVEIVGSDNGRGIPAKVLADRGQTHCKLGGSGLGLYNAKTSMESWGGSLLVKSLSGSGTEVRLSFLNMSTPS